MIAHEWAEDPGNVSTADRAERALLGVLLVRGEGALPRCARLRAGDFRSPHRAAVLTAMRKLAFLETPIDELTVAYELEKGKVPPPAGSGWLSAVSSLTDYMTVGSADDDSITAYARIVAEASLLRRRAAWGAR